MRPGIRVTIPDEIYDQYDRQDPGKAEELIEKRLRDTASWPKLPLCLHDTERRQLETALKQNFRDGAQLAKAVARLSKVKIDKAELQLDTVVIERLRTHCPTKAKFEEFLTNLIREMLERYVGLR
jgi:hypothetical protein